MDPLKINKIQFNSEISTNRTFTVEEQSAVSGKNETTLQSSANPLMVILLLILLFFFNVFLMYRGARKRREIREE